MFLSARSVTFDIFEMKLAVFWMQWPSSYAIIKIESILHAQFVALLGNNPLRVVVC